MHVMHMSSVNLGPVVFILLGSCLCVRPHLELQASIVMFFAPSSFSRPWWSLPPLKQLRSACGYQRMLHRHPQSHSTSMSPLMVGHHYASPLMLVLSPGRHGGIPCLWVQMLDGPDSPSAFSADHWPYLLPFHAPFIPASACRQYLDLRHFACSFAPWNRQTTPVMPVVRRRVKNALVIDEWVQLLWTFVLFAPLAIPVTCLKSWHLLSTALLLYIAWNLHYLCATRHDCDEPICRW